MKRVLALVLLLMLLLLSGCRERGITSEQAEEILRGQIGESIVLSLSNTGDVDGQLCHVFQAAAVEPLFEGGLASKAFRFYAVNTETGAVYRVNIETNQLIPLDPEDTLSKEPNIEP